MYVATADGLYLLDYESIIQIRLKELFTTENTKDTEKILRVLCVLSVVSLLNRILYSLRRNG